MMISSPLRSVSLAALFCGGLVGLSPFLVAQEERPPEERPRWEVGLVGGGVVLPHYPGSDEVYAVPIGLPYFIYRGKYLESNNGGLKGVLYRSERVDLKLSLSGHPPVGNDNDAREGMESLDPVLEIGPSLDVYAHRNSESALYAKLSLRNGFGLDFDDPGFDSVGATGTLEARYQKYRLGKEGLRWGMRAGVEFSSAEFNSYFYAVSEEEATEVREVFESDAGYAGCFLSQGIFYDVNSKFAVGMFGNWRNLTGAAFEDSYLVRRENSFSFGLMMVVELGRSKHLVGE